MKSLRYAAVIITAAILCLSLSACDLLSALNDVLDIGSYSPKKDGEKTDHPYTSTDVSETPVSGEYSGISSRYCYNRLSRAQQLCYDGIIENAYEIYPEIDEDLTAYRMPQVIVDGYIMSSADIRVALRAVTDDNPYLFWISQGFAYEIYSDENYTVVHAYSEFSVDEVTSMTAEVNKAMKGFYESVPAGLSEYEREKFTHDYIIERCEYDDEEHEGDNIKAHSVYGVLADGKSVCEGYGKTMQLLLNGLGVECVSLTGSSYNSVSDMSEGDAQLHLWNCVRLDGNWYNVDVTWDDQDEVMYRYDYFNLDDEHFSSDHTLSPMFDELSDKEIDEKGTENMNIFVPECRDDVYNYFVYECPHLVSIEYDTLSEPLYEAAVEQEQYFIFYIEEHVDFSDAIKQLFKEYPQYFFTYVNEVNNRLYDYEIDNSRMYYYFDENRRTVAVDLKYY